MNFRSGCVIGLACFCISLAAFAGRYDDRVDPAEAAEAVLRCGAKGRELLKDPQRVIKSVEGDFRDESGTISTKRYTFKTEIPSSPSNLFEKPGPTLKVTLTMYSGGFEKPGRDSWLCEIEDPEI